MLTAYHPGRGSKLSAVLSGRAEEIHYADLYQHFAPVAKFWAGIDRRGAGLVSETADVQLSLSGSDDGALSWVSLLSRGAIVLSNSTTAYAYVYPRLMSSGDVFARTDDSPMFPMQKNAWLTLPDQLAAGEYRVEFWNTSSGECFAEELLRVAASQESSHRLKLPPFRVDLAVRIEPL